MWDFVHIEKTFLHFFYNAKLIINDTSYLYNIFDIIEVKARLYTLKTPAYSDLIEAKYYVTLATRYTDMYLYNIIHISTADSTYILAVIRLHYSAADLSINKLSV